MVSGILGSYQAPFLALAVACKGFIWASESCFSKAFLNHDEVHFVLVFWQTISLAYKSMKLRILMIV
jgi:hypothetical protein